MSLIRAEGVRKIYRAKRRKGDEANRDTVALEDVNLEIHEGEVLALVGPSGCGKSTFLDIVAGLAEHDGGAVYLGGRKITGPGLDRGLVFQGYALVPWKTVLDNVAFGLEAQGVGRVERHEIARRFVDLVGLSKFEDRYPHELSGGMKQRVAIARALALDPRVLLMDEPFGALDAITRQRLQIELNRIVAETGVTLVFITHSIEEALVLGDRIVVLGERPSRVVEIVDVRGLGGPDTVEHSAMRGRLRSLLTVDRGEVVADGGGLE